MIDAEKHPPRDGGLSRILPDGRELRIYPMIYNARLVVSRSVSAPEYDNAWCYATLVGAVKAMVEWNPDTELEPEGWIRHPGSGRRRPDGDKTREYVSP
jgi:hypothetical protein